MVLLGSLEPFRKLYGTRVGFPHDVGVVMLMNLMAECIVFDVRPISGIMLPIDSPFVSSMASPVSTF